MPEEIWHRADATTIKNYLNEHTRTGFQLMLGRVLKKKIDAEQLGVDFATAIVEFISKPSLWTRPQN
jgi:hypothetical protein